MLLLPLRLDLAPHLGHRLILYFNPRTPVGCAPMQKYSTTVSKFQSTHPSGVQPKAPKPSSKSGHFNPRTPVGCDPDAIDYYWVEVLFQSTHPSGVRLLPCVAAGTRV